MRRLPLAAAERFGRHMRCDLMTAMAEFWQACYRWPNDTTGA